MKGEGMRIGVGYLDSAGHQATLHQCLVPNLRIRAHQIIIILNVHSISTIYLVLRSALGEYRKEGVGQKRINTWS